MSSTSATAAVSTRSGARTAEPTESCSRTTSYRTRSEWPRVRRSCAASATASASVAATGASVVRLKSGDAGVFGRLEEEVEALRSAGIAYEIVPGVTSACAAGAAAGIPLTRRHTARRVQFITGADVKGELPDDLHWDALADPNAMTAVYMGKRTFPALAAKLIAHGLSPDTPALLAESVGQADQRLVRTTVKQLAEQLGQENVTATAVILYGALAADDP